MFATAVRCRNFLFAGLLSAVCCAGFGITPSLHAAVIVFSNDTPQTVAFVVGDSAADRVTHKAYQVAPGDVLPIPTAGEKIVWFDVRQGSAEKSQPDIQNETVRPNSIYTFTGELPLTLKHHFSVGMEGLASSSNPALAQNLGGALDLDAVVTIPIMILVDDDEPRRQEIWEKELRERVDDASDIFERTSRIRFQIVKIDTWETDDRTTDFDRTLDEFQKKVKPEPGIALAIGFTSQYEVQTKGRFHMGGTKGPLFPYILIREWSQHVGKPERLELLVHELGHVFGATHTRDQSSVMRPVVGDNRSNDKSFRIGFDPLNTLAMYLFCEPIRLEGVRSLRQYSGESRAALVSVYSELARRFPDDHSGALYREIIQRSSRIRLLGQDQIHRQEKMLVEATRLVVRVIALRASNMETSDSDRRFEQCMQVAAGAVEKLPPELAARAMMLGVGIALDPSGKLRELPGFQTTYDEILPPEERLKSQAAIGQLTIHGNVEWAERFASTLGKSVLISPTGAEAAAIIQWWKAADDRETGDLRDTAIDIAATTLASRLLAGQIPTATLAERFDMDHYLPDETFWSTLTKPLASESLNQLYGSPTDPRFLKFKATVRQKIGTSGN